MRLPVCTCSTSDGDAKIHRFLDSSTRPAAASPGPPLALPSSAPCHGTLRTQWSALLVRHGGACASAAQVTAVYDLTTRLGYLRVVYGSDPPPRRLTDMSWWYHHHERWPAAVEWPMARCVGGGGRPWSRHPSTTMCDPATCRRWLAQEYDPSQSRFRAYAAWAERARTGAPSPPSECGLKALSPRNNYSCVFAMVLRGSASTSRATYLSEKVQQGPVRGQFYTEAVSKPAAAGVPLASCLAEQAMHDKGEARFISASMTLLGRGQPCGHDEWIEVFRDDDRALGATFAGNEGHGGYGCWFFPALGSGVFLNVGRTKLIYRKSNVADLMAEWQGRGREGAASASKWGTPTLQNEGAQGANGSPPGAALQAVHGGGARNLTGPRHNAAEVARLARNPRREGFPIMAADAGYDSVQIYHNTVMGSPEMVVTRRVCMADNAVPLRQCVPLLDLRTWAGRHSAASCACNDSLPGGLNCAGVGEDRL